MTFARILRKYLFDGQVAGACGNGHVIFAHVIEKRFEWRDYEASVTGRKTIALRNVTNDAWEQLEFRDRIIQVLMVTKYLRMFRTITYLLPDCTRPRAPGGSDDVSVLRLHHQELEYSHHLRPQGRIRLSDRFGRETLPLGRVKHSLTLQLRREAPLQS